jgi:trk system potassium uptake protein TrkA
MYIIIAGGGKVGYYLAKELLADGHEILVIEKDPRQAMQLSAELGEGAVMRGMADETATMERAGGSRADLVIAVTGDDEDNLVICQVARLRFKVARTIARVNNPQNEELFHRLGINITVSSTRLILSLIEQELPSRPFIPLVKLRSIGMEIVELALLANSPLIGKKISNINLPPGSTVSLIIRDEQTVIPTSETVMQPGDKLIGFTPIAVEGQVEQAVRQ